MEKHFKKLSILIGDTAVNKRKEYYRPHENNPPDIGIYKRFWFIR